MMGAALWSGTLTASRYSVPCPACGEPARTDCDTLGRTVVICRCRRGSFPIPLTVGGSGAAWPVDLANLPIEQSDYLPRKNGVRRCGWGDCPRAVGPRSNYCGRCSPLAAARQRVCPEPGCDNTMGYRSQRCTSCALEHHRASIRQYNRERRAKLKHDRELTLELGL